MEKLKKWYIAKLIGSIVLLGATIYLAVGFMGKTAVLPAVILFGIVLLVYGGINLAIHRLSDGESQ